MLQPAILSGIEKVKTWREAVLIKTADFTPDSDNDFGLISRYVDVEN